MSEVPLYCALHRTRERRVVAQGIFLLYGLQGALFLVSEVPHVGSNESCGASGGASCVACPTLESS
jgi:hypothetical protein